MRRSQIILRWLLMVVVGFVGFGYLASGLLGSASEQDAEIANLDTSVQQAEDLRSVIDNVNAEFQTVWDRDQVEVAPAGNWETICRRLSLALIGSGISVEEFRWLESLPEEQRVATLLERLLTDRRFTDYWAERFARSYVGADEGPFIVFRRRRFVNWLSNEIDQETSYAQIVRSMITGEGIWTENPEVNFLTVTMDSNDDGRADPIRLAARTSRAFLGMRIDCLQCHDDFLSNVNLGTSIAPEPGTQEHFHQLAAFYSGSVNSIKGIREDGQEYEYQYLYADEEEVVEPTVPFLRELVDAETENPRARLANWVTHSENIPFARATVNRVWALMFGKPLSDPVDDIPLHGPFPPGLDWLAHDVAEHDGDLRRLIRIIANLDVYQRDSRCDFPVTERHENAWAVFPLIRLRPEQVAGSIVQACRLSTIGRDSSIISQLQAFGDKNEFVQRYGDTGEDEFNRDAITITQRLLAMNGKLVRERTEGNPVGNASAQIAMFAQNDRQAIEVAYVAALNRRPTEDEFSAWLEKQKDVERGPFIEDVFWALLNGSEFSWNH